VKAKIAPRALQRARIVKAWWRKNRPGAEEMFEREFDELTGKLIELSPRSPLGTIHAVRRNTTIRRVLLRKTNQHVFYSIREADDTVIIRAIWAPAADGLQSSDPPSRLRTSHAAANDTTDCS
jgi:hypothetical protein